MNILYIHISPTWTRKMKKMLLKKRPHCYPASPASATIKNATFGRKRRFLQDCVQLQATFCPICPKSLCLLGTPTGGVGGGVWGGLHVAGAGEGDRRGPPSHIMSALRTGATTSHHHLLWLHNQVSCFQPPIQSGSAAGPFTLWF